jgi:hypothetical protein
VKLSLHVFFGLIASQRHGVKESPPSSAKVKNACRYNISPNAFMAWYLVKDTDYFTFTEQIRNITDILQWLLFSNKNHLYSLFPIVAMKDVGPPTPGSLVCRKSEKKELHTIGTSIDQWHSKKKKPISFYTQLLFIEPKFQFQSIIALVVI